jgi:endonuclease-3
VLNVAFGASTMAVDTHIFRVANRTGLAPGTSPRAVEDALVRRIPPEMLRDAHHLLILHGRYVCKARVPECWRCIAAQWCRYPNKTPAPSAAPKPGKGRPARDLTSSG